MLSFAAFGASTKLIVFTRTVKIMALKVCCFCIFERNTVIQHIVLVCVFKLCKMTGIVFIFFNNSYFAVRDGNGSPRKT